MIARSFQRQFQNIIKQKQQPLLCLNQYKFYNFCTHNKSQTKNKTEIDEQTRQIFDDLKNKDSLGTGAQRFNKEKTFGNYTIYEHPMDNKEIKLKINLRLLASSFWFGTGVAVFHFVHHLAALIPLLIMSRSIMAYRVGKTYTRSLINKVEISEDKLSVKLYAVSGDIYDCLIEEMDFQGINDLSDAKQNDPQLKNDSNSELSKLKQSSFLAIFDTTDKNGKYRRDLKILFNDSLVNMENAELLTKILRGDKESVMKFEYVNEYQDHSEELTDEQLEEQIQQEIRKKKQ